MAIFCLCCLDRIEDEVNPFRSSPLIDPSLLRNIAQLLVWQSLSLSPALFVWIGDCYIFKWDLNESEAAVCVYVWWVCISISNALTKTANFNRQINSHRFWIRLLNRRNRNPWWLYIVLWNDERMIYKVNTKFKNKYEERIAFLLKLQYLLWRQPKFHQHTTADSYSILRRDDEYNNTNTHARETSHAPRANRRQFKRNDWNSCEIARQFIGNSLFSDVIETGRRVFVCWMRRIQSHRSIIQYVFFGARSVVLATRNSTTTHNILFICSNIKATDNVNHLFFHGRNENNSKFWLSRFEIHFDGALCVLCQLSREFDSQTSRVSFYCWFKRNEIEKWEIYE